MLEELVLNQFEDSLRSIDLNLYSLVKTRSEANHLVGELVCLVSKKDWHETPLDELLAGVSDSEMLKSLKVLGESSVRAMLKRAHRFFASPVGAPGLLASVQKFIAKLDVEELMSSPQGVLERATIRQQLANDTMRHRLSREALLEIFPPTVRRNESFALQPKLQLLEYLNEIVHHSFEFDLMDDALALLQSACADCREVSMDSSDRARFFFSCCDISSEQLCGASRDVVVRHMAVSPFFTQRFSERLRAFTNVQQLVASVHTTMSTSFQMMIFRGLNQSVTGINLATRVPAFHDQFTLVNAFLDGFVTHADANTSASQILMSFTPSVATRLQGLSLQALGLLLSTAASLSTSSLGIRTIAAALDASTSIDPREPWLTRSICAQFLHKMMLLPSSNEVTISVQGMIDPDDADELRNLMLQKCGSSRLWYSILHALDLVGFVPRVFADWGEIVENIGASLESVDMSRASIQPFPDVSLEEFPLDVATRIFMIEGPFLLFEAVSLRCQTIDLIKVFGDALNQYLLVAALAGSHSELFSKRRSEATHSLSKLKDIVEKDDLFDDIVPVIRRLTESELTQICDAFTKEIETASQVGFAVCKMLDRQKLISRDGARTMAHIHTAAHSIFLKGRFNRDVVTDVLLGLDPERFSSASFEERNFRLSEITDNEKVSMTLSGQEKSDASISSLFNFCSGVLRDIHNNKEASAYRFDAITKTHVSDFM
jgi:hypothetical protein